MKNTVFLNNIIRAVFILMILIFVFIKNEQLYLRLFILAFILLTICIIAKNVCSSLNKLKMANFFINYLLSFFFCLLLSL